eukprot:gene5834-9037_t
MLLLTCENRDSSRCLYTAPTNVCVDRGVALGTWSTHTHASARMFSIQLPVYPDVARTAPAAKYRFNAVSRNEERGV